MNSQVDVVKAEPPVVPASPRPSEPVLVAFFSECNVCQERFALHEDLVRHMTCHLVTHPVACRRCPVRCATSAQLSDHIKQHHVTLKRRRKPAPAKFDRRLRCTACGIDSFPSFSYFHDHHLYHHLARRPEPQVILERPPIGAAAGAALKLTLRRSSQEAERPAAPVSRRRHRQPRTGPVNSSSHTLPTLQLLHWGHVIPSDGCSSTGSDSGMDSSETAAPPSSGTVSCFVCNVPLPDVRSLQEHLLTHQSSLQCSMCPFKANSVSDLKAHSVTFHGKMQTGAIGRPPNSDMSGHMTSLRPMGGQPGPKRPMPGLVGHDPSKRPRPGIPIQPDKSDCQVIAVQRRQQGVPVIQNVEGSAYASGAGGSTIRLSDSITLSVQGAQHEKAHLGGPSQNLRCRVCGIVMQNLALLQQHMQTRHGSALPPPAQVSREQLEGLGVRGFLPVSQVNQRQGQLGLPIISLQGLGKTGPSPRPVAFFNLGPVRPLR
ncbi:flt3-interacting zinc finger protein 1-like [Pollicipes pollicipes]|uniref:flt3-interacting zinc finger protein 1-like n=1 Tax=Pollicipes pollicipes TaxID=41117 RepID=UPI0018853425|nr:flt3-interacting zinc finger protein 1-like [Pollicipes pollicipes]